MEQDYLCYKQMIDELLEDQIGDDIIMLKEELIKRCAKCRLWCGYMNTCDFCLDNYHPKCEELEKYCKNCKNDYGFEKTELQKVHKYEPVIFDGKLNIVTETNENEKQNLINLYQKNNWIYTDELNYMVNKSKNNPELMNHVVLSEENLQTFNKLKEFTKNKHFNGLSLQHNQQYGYHVIAVKNIPKHTLIGEYVGEVFARRTILNKDGKYYFDLIVSQISSDDIIVDGEKYGNITRFINNSKTNDNCYPIYANINNELRILLVTSRDIWSGEQIFYDYGDHYNI